MKYHLCWLTSHDYTLVDGTMYRCLRCGVVWDVDVPSTEPLTLKDELDIKRIQATIWLSEIGRDDL